MCRNCVVQKCLLAGIPLEQTNRFNGERITPINALHTFHTATLATGKRPDKLE